MAYTLWLAICLSLLRTVGGGEFPALLQAVSQSLVSSTQESLALRRSFSALSSSSSIAEPPHCIDGCHEGLMALLFTMSLEEIELSK